ncbi:MULTISPECIES: RagB/SusD family nutrient uptake outer membrane protein [Duncaniella]|uniref:RagB/SusD family nutrient uptake outer membrane protein n=3 Tax=Duncaniella TaxID=2518495 RepID=A0A4P7W2Y4_9BACT|nr:MULTISPECIES: RagB/SusD family nutrient uptake outer membrane protein [Duncaniella]MBJ2190309.1 RagB/SusD family nutrient uptake outer membrane protein [Muribaculaceae bacterium]QCD42314.1 RagB/SusD family nutrient uptake outer membrane protein [Duncaniella dubosii]HBN62273.1 RagB/SusD family nutrient uptake outer membrane protein [Porphyromonadaceae bacterium]
MKFNISLAGSIVALAVSLSACESLDFTPADQMSGQTFWKTEEHARQAAVGMYAAMKAPWCFGMEFTFDMCSDIADGTSPWADISRGSSFASNSSGVQNHWQYLYELVHRANTVIRNVATMPISQETIDRVTGEAKFLRAMAYFRMLNCWGGVPYYDESCDINNEFANLDSPRSSADEIRGHILDDLNDAIEKLPVRWDDADLGRATKGAAYALRGKVYLYNRQWDEAASDFEEIVYNRTNDYGYALHDSYDNLFRLYNGAHSNEMIFSIQSIDGNTSGYALDIVSYFGNKSTMRLIAGNAIVPSTTLADMYENTDGSPFDWDDVFLGFNAGDETFRRKCLSVAIDQSSTVVTSTLDCDTTKVMDAYRLRDPRLCLNIITPYSHYLGTDAASSPMDKQFVLADPTKGGAPMEAMAFIRNSEGWNSYFWRKWIPTGNLDGYWGEYNRTPYEFPLIRLGDVILMLAEAYNEKGETDKAVTEVNKIRARVGMPGLNSGATWLAVGSKEEMAERIMRERAFELAGEGQRYWDLRRWGKLKESVKNATDIYGNLMYTRSYQERHELWPIPLVELDRNKNLTQNTGW